MSSSFLVLVVIIKAAGTFIFVYWQTYVIMSIGYFLRNGITGLEGKFIFCKSFLFFVLVERLLPKSYVMFFSAEAVSAWIMKEVWILLSVPSCFPACSSSSSLLLSNFV